MSDKSDHDVSDRRRPPSASPNLPEPQLRQLETLHRASKRLQRFFEPEELAQEIIGVLEETLGYDYCAVLLADQSTASLVPYAVSEQGNDRTFVQQDKAYIASCGIAVGVGITGMVAETGVTQRIDDVTQDPRYLSVRAGIRSELCVPLISSGRILGVINVETVRPASFTATDQLVLECVAAQIAIAIDKFRLSSEARAAQKMKLVGELAGGIAHDLGNLLMVVSLQGQLLAAHVDGKSRAESDLHRLREAAGRATRLSRQLLDFCSRQAGRPQQLNLNGVLENLVELLTCVVTGNANLELRLADRLDCIVADQSHVEQIIMNLVVNANQAMQHGGEIVIETANVQVNDGDAPLPAVAPGNYVVMRITDTGTGMDRDLQSRVFQPFFTTRSNGSGLGLSVVKRLTEAASGSVWFDSEPGKGTVFHLCFPKDH